MEPNELKALVEAALAARDIATAAEILNSVPTVDLVPRPGSLQAVRGQLRRELSKLVDSFEDTADQLIIRDSETGTTWETIPSSSVKLGDTFKRL